MKKLAFCLFNYFPYGGLQRDFMRIARECHARGHEIHVYTMHWEAEHEADFHLHLIQARGWQNHTRIHSFTKQLARELAKSQYDLVIGFNKMPGLDVYYAADVCYQARVREEHSFFYRLLPRYHQLRTMEEAVFARANHTNIFLISPLQQAAFEKYYATEAARFHVLPPGIAKDRMAPPDALMIRARVRDRLQIPADHQLVLMIASAFKTKGLDRAILALASLPPSVQSRIHFIVLGQDDPKTFISLAQQAKLSAQLHFLGGCKEVADFLLAADLLLHPAYHENTGTVILEAMIAGLPVLTTDICGYAHYVIEANAGKVLSSPFQQGNLNHLLQSMLMSDEQSIWRQNGLDFASSADIYRMPQVAADLIDAKEKIVFDQDAMMSLDGEIFRKQQARMTKRVMMNGQSCFIKQHTGVGWKEIFKNLFQGRLPVLSAKNEYLALEKLRLLGISVPAVLAFEQRGWNPARLQSYILMQELKPVISLEDLTKTWKIVAPDFVYKQKLIEEIARIARVMHQHGINHRDFYLCHFLLELAQKKDAPIKLSLIDLHRAQCRRRVPLRWLIKDLSALLFSCKDVYLTERDCYRFIKVYSANSLGDELSANASFWQKVKNRGHNYRDHTQS